jgi:hypothetical protein
MAKFQVKFPECGSTDLRRSQFRVFDIIPFVLFMVPLRCRKCRRRFFNWRWEKVEIES